MAAEEVQKLSEMLPWIGVILHNTEERQQVNEDVRLWLAEIKEIERDADDVVDEFITKSARRQARRQGTHCSHLSSSFKLFCQIPSRHRMGREIKIIRKKWVELRQKCRDLKFVTGDPGAASFDGISLSRRPESNSMFADRDFFGREEDKDCLRKKLLAGVVDNSREEPSSSSSAAYRPMEASILSIVAMGGMGKTALAQVVYNDIQSYFPLHKWLFVGEHFNAKSLIQKILGEQQGERSLDEPEEDLIRVVQDRRFLFVLDDVWYDQPSALKDFLNLLKHFGCRGSKVLVTTRSLEVALAIGNYKDVYQLKPLADENCWSIFAKHAFPGDNSIRHPRLEEIGRDMVRNLKGLPLAAKIMGGMLGNTNSLEERRQMLDDLMEQVVGLSYWQLPSYLKQCVAYCAMFPKRFQFEKMRLVQMWMAQGFLEYPTMIGGGRMEDAGGDCFEYLLRESFFQLGELAEELDDVREDYTADGEQTYVMHDIIHTFVQSVSHAECWFTDEKNLGLPEKPWHMSFCCATTNSAALAGLSGKFPKLRSLVHSCGSNFISFREFPLKQVFGHLRCVRVLDLKGCLIKNLPDSVGELIHLRYLDLTHTGLDRLPESLCNLHNLQTLRWADGFDLPKGTSKLVNLRCLDAMLVHSFPRIGRLTALQKLDRFKVGKESGYKIEELADMEQLRGKLSIINLENVIGGWWGAASAKMRDKRYLRSLELEWSQSVVRHGYGDLEVLVGLEPHRELEDIQIRNNMGGRPPFWMGGGWLSNLVSVTLDHCLLWSSLPALGALRHLRSLFIKDMRAVKAVGHEFYSVDEFGSTEEPPFPRLEVLVFAGMTEWEEWSIPESSPCGRRPFPILRVLRMTDCPKLRVLPPVPPSVVELEIVGVGLGGGVLSVDVGDAISSEPCLD